MGGLCVNASYGVEAGAKGDIDTELKETGGETKGWVNVALGWIGYNQDFVFLVAFHCASEGWLVVITERHHITCIY
ncbi:hypothetical protein HanRHA438_Chr14g0645971 [Helianthus annuus]|nr:hypothetical protein HanHA89_Chr14g0564521 [Helianthus annuus]KAJ0655663.1 hypothetical protein HanLR1_Chr14g0526871 [Helianthus annuus]KAJ0659348.1 hypothetical protein HanOQP8_Chr14g0525071 [Helianthus annuus]KAJ0852984.1 hypothetical protein HanRHA438_Chr14g0645971 [Helianthus annuus]